MRISEALIYLLVGIFLGVMLGVATERHHAEKNKWAALAVYEGYIAERDTLIRTMITEVDSANAVARRAIASMKRCNNIAERAIAFANRGWDVQFNQMTPELPLGVVTVNPERRIFDFQGRRVVPCPANLPGCLVLHYEIDELRIISKNARIRTDSALTLPPVSTLRVR